MKILSYKNIFLSFKNAFFLQIMDPNTVKSAIIISSVTIKYYFIKMCELLKDSLKIQLPFWL